MVYDLSISQLSLSIRFIKPIVLYRLSAVSFLGAGIRFLGYCDTTAVHYLSESVRFIYLSILHAVEGTFLFSDSA